MSTVRGSKAVSGYSWDREPATHPEDYLGYAAATVTTHQYGTYSNNTSKDWAEAVGYKMIDPTTLSSTPAGIEARKTCLFDTNTTLKIMLFVKGNELLICFGAKNCFETECSPSQRFRFNLRQWFQILGNFLGLVPNIYPLAARVTCHINSLPEFAHLTPVLAGHSFGGSLAQFAGLQERIKVVVVNSAPLGAGLQNHLGQPSLLSASSLIRHLSVNGDYLSHSRLGGIDRWISARGIKTPGSFGKRESISSAFPLRARYAHHAYIMGSIGVACGLGNPINGADLAAKLRARLPS